MQSTISICVPAYNAVAYLPEALQSIRRQTFHEWELIVVEDGSDDDTRVLVEEFAKGGVQPVRYIRHEQNRGLTATRNTAVRMAQGDWIALLDADDIWEADHLRECISLAESLDIDIIHGASVLFDSATNQELAVRAPSLQDIQNLPDSLYCGEYLIQPSSVIIKRSLCQMVEGFNEAYQHAEDREMWIRCLRRGAKLGYTGKLTCRYRKHSNAMSRNVYAMASANARIYRDNLDWELIPEKKRVSLLHNSLVSAGRLIWKHRPKVAFIHFQEALKLKIEIRTILYILICKFNILRSRI